MFIFFIQEVRGVGGNDNRNVYRFSFLKIEQREPDKGAAIHKQEPHLHPALLPLWLFDADGRVPLDNSFFQGWGGVEWQETRVCQNLSTLPQLAHLFVYLDIRNGANMAFVEFWLKYNIVGQTCSFISYIVAK